MSRLRVIEATGWSAAAARVRQHLAAGRCACAVRNLRGACCLGDVIATVKHLEALVMKRSADVR